VEIDTEKATDIGIDKKKNHLGKGKNKKNDKHRKGNTPKITLLQQ
jgi:hypothetical protein